MGFQVWEGLGVPGAVKELPIHLSIKHRSHQAPQGFLEEDGISAAGEASLVLFANSRLHGGFGAAFHLNLSHRSIGVCHCSHDPEFDDFGSPGFLVGCANAPPRGALLSRLEVLLKFSCLVGLFGPGSGLCQVVQPLFAPSLGGLSCLAEVVAQFLVPQHCLPN